jgi:predicted nucleic acid-binding protein
VDLTVDTSAVLAVVLKEPSRAQLLEVTRGAELRAPGSLPWEIGNACSALVKRGRLDAKQASLAIASYQQIPIQLVPIELEESVRLASEHGIYAYDAYMLTCARRFRTPLLTLDDALARIAQKVGIHVLEVEP